MTQDSNPPTAKTVPDAEVLIPVLAFGGTLAGILLWNAGVQFDFQYAAIGSFLASCLLAYLAWTRVHKDIVALSTPIYGFIFMVTPIDYAGGVVLQLVYAAGLTILAARLHSRFGPGIAGGPDTKELVPGPLRDYVESGHGSLTGLDPATGSDAAKAFLDFSEGEYKMAADCAHAASCRDGIPGYAVRAFAILCQHAEQLDRNLPRPVTFLTFLPDDAVLLAKPLPEGGDPDREYEMQMDNALLLLYSTAWHASPSARPALLVSQGFAKKLMESQG